MGTKIAAQFGGKPLYVVLWFIKGWFRGYDIALRRCCAPLKIRIDGF